MCRGFCYQGISGSVSLRKLPEGLKTKVRSKGLGFRVSINPELGCSFATQGDKFRVWGIGATRMQREDNGERVRDTK